MADKRKPPNAGKGRVKGVPNKATADVRAVVTAIAQNKAADVERWMEQTANGVLAKDKDGKDIDGQFLVKPDPGRAAQVYFGMLEFHIPKLCRTEISTGSDTLKVEIVDPTRRDGKAA